LTVDDRPDQQDNRTIARRLVMELAQGCGDHSCRFKKPSGMGTNGGCRCIDKIEDALSRRSTVTPERREYDFNVVRVYCLRHPRTAMGYNAMGFLCGECRAAVTVFGPSEPTVTPEALTTCDGWTPCLRSSVPPVEGRSADRECPECEESGRENCAFHESRRSSHDYER
jgi:hypothetical protein